MTFGELLRRFPALLDAPARRRLLALCALSVAAALMESVAVASIVPFLAALASPEVGTADPRLSALLRFLGANGQRDALLHLGAVVLGLLLAANALSAATTWLMLRFANRQGQALSTRLLASYLSRPYSFYLDRHTAELQKNVFGEVYRVTGGVLIPAVQILAKASVAIFIAALLVTVDPGVALVAAGVLAGGYAILYALARKTLRKAGEISVEAGAARAQHGIEALSAVKDIKLLGREANFLVRFEEPSRRWADAQTRTQALSQLPRYAIETLAFGAILVLALYLITGRDGAGVLPLLGLYAFAGYRLMPALQVIFSGLATIRQGGASLELVLREIAEPVPALAAHPPEEPLPILRGITLRDVGFTYPGQKQWALRDINLHIPRNTSVALVGTTGCGKTTTVDLLMGLLQPGTGRIEVDGIDIVEAGIRRWQRSIGHVPQQIFLCDDTIARNIAFGVPDDQIDWGRVEQAARLARLHDFVSGALPEGYRTRVGERGIRLSGGQRQRIGVARALYTDPALLILDEATSALDNATESAVFEALQALAGRKTIVMVAHRLSTVRACDLVCLMEDGQIVEQGSFVELLSSSPRFRALATADAH